MVDVQYKTKGNLNNGEGTIELCQWFSNNNNDRRTKKAHKVAKLLSMAFILRSQQTNFQFLAIRSRMPAAALHHFNSISFCCSR